MSTSIDIESLNEWMVALGTGAFKKVGSGNNNNPWTYTFTNFGLIATAGDTLYYGPGVSATSGNGILQIASVSQSCGRSSGGGMNVHLYIVLPGTTVKITRNSSYYYSFGVGEFDPS